MDDSIAGSRGAHHERMRVGPLRFPLAGVNCSRCEPTTQFVPWAEHATWQTYDFGDLVACKARGTDQTGVAKYTVEQGAGGGVAVWPRRPWLVT